MSLSGVIIKAKLPILTAVYHYCLTVLTVGQSIWRKYDNTILLMLEN